VALDGDAALALKVHVVQCLILHVPLVDGFGMFQQAVGEGAFAVVNVRDDAEVADMLHLIDSINPIRSIDSIFIPRNNPGKNGRKGSFFPVGARCLVMQQTRKFLHPVYVRSSKQKNTDSAMPNRLLTRCFLALLFFPLPGSAQSIFDSLRLAHRAEVFFAFGKHDLDGHAVAVLDSFAGVWAGQQNPHAVQITAHTDSVGNLENNTALSQRRANAVREALTKRGLPESKIRISFFGEHQPVAENATEEGRQRNRRATLEFYTSVPMAPYSGQVTDKNTGDGIAATVHFSTRTRRDSVLTDSTGRFSVRLPQDSVVKTEVYAAGYFFESAMQKIFGTPEMLRRMQAEPLVIALPRAASGEKVAMKNFYFVGNEAILLKTSEPELPKVLKFMQVNSEIRIEIAGHVNNPFKTPEQLEKWEWNLSISRAKLVFDYLLRNGIPAGRMSYKGYGNTEMLFPMPSATAEQQEQNRRVEIRVK